MNSLLAPDSRCAVVFSHPNHELAIFGLLQRTRPRIVFLTDGGGPERVADSRRGLDRLGLGDHAGFLGHPEGDLYAALLDRDVAFFGKIAGEVRDSLAPIEPTHVLCDAVEGYNPVHDLAVPVVRHAFRDTPLYEVPLVYERPGTVGDYVVQCFPEDHPQPPSQLELTREEHAEKLAARDEVYPRLREQLGGLLHPTDGRFGREEIAPAPARVPSPGPRRSLRYERRGERLRQRGEVKAAITHDAHYRPVAEALFAG